MVRLDLQTLNLLPYIEMKTVEDRAQAQQCLLKSVSKSIALNISKLTPFEAVDIRGRCQICLSSSFCKVMWGCDAI